MEKWIWSGIALLRRVPGLGTRPSDTMNHASRKGEPDADTGILLTRAEAPRFSRIVSRLATELESPSPDEIRLSYLPTACIHQYAESGEAKGRSVLLIGMPCLQILTLAELRAVIAHELAHLKYGDAALSRLLPPMSMAVGDHGESSPVGSRSATSRGWIRWLEMRANRTRHAMEYRADRASADVVGPWVLATALRRLAVVQPIFHEALAKFDPEDAPRATVYEHFASVWRKLPADRLIKLGERLVDRPPDPASPGHPSVAQRVAHLEKHPDFHPPTTTSPPALELLQRVEVMQRLLHQRLFSLPSGRTSCFVAYRTRSASGDSVLADWLAKHGQRTMRD